MIKEISVENFLSIKEKSTLTMEKGRERVFSDKNIIPGTNLLKSAFIFGPNGSGKTNFELAFNRMQKLVIRQTNDVDETLMYDPFLFDDSYNNAPTEFSVDFIDSNNYEYKYSIKYNSEKFIEEILYFKNKLLWERNEDSVVIHDDEKKEYFQKYDFSKLRDNVNLIWFLQDNNESMASNIFKWFKNDVFFFNSSSLNDGDIPEFFADALIEIHSDDERNFQFLNFMRASGFNYTGLVVREVPRNIPQQLVENMPTEIKEMALQPKKEIYIQQKAFKDNDVIDVNRELPLGFESLGSKVFIMISILLFSNLLEKGNKTIFIDEFGVYLHEQLVKALTHDFNKGNYNDNQFIINSHNINIMEENIRFDQIYLMNKNYKGESELYSIYDFDDLSLKRHDYHVVKRYLDGKFGASPEIDLDLMATSLKNAHNIDNEGVF